MKRILIKSPLFILLFLMSVMSLYGQPIDSLLNNKRVYSTVNIGELSMPRIDGVLVKLEIIT